MSSKVFGLLAHLSKFLSVGVVNSVVGYLSFVVLQLLLFHQTDFGYFFSLAGSYLVAVPVAFFLYRRYVFDFGARPNFQIVRFSGVYVASIAINAFSLGVLVEGFGWNEFLAQFSAMGLAAAASYLGHRFFSFRS